jgi:hypothetical protein
MLKRTAMSYWRLGAALAGVGLLGVVVPLGTAHAREIYCASDEEAGDLNGRLLDMILGPSTRLVQDSNAPNGRINTVWSGQAQLCPVTLKDACQGRVDHAEATSYTHLVSIGGAADLTGTGTWAHWIPILAMQYGYAKTRATVFDVALTLNIPPGQTWQPVVEVRQSVASGHYVGGYRHVGEATRCHQYALDPNRTFGRYQATLQDGAVSTWEHR